MALHVKPWHCYKIIRTNFNVGGFTAFKNHIYVFGLSRNGYNAIYTGISGDEYDQKVARQCIDRIATHCAKLEPKHIKSSLSKIMDSQVGYLLANRPNPIMNTYDFMYKVISNLYTNKNAFIYIHRNQLGIVQGFYPLMAVSEQLYEGEDGTIYLQFQFMNGKIYTLPYLELIHLRLFYNQNDIFGTVDNILSTDLETTHIASEGIKNAIRTSTKKTSSGLSVL